MRVHEAAKKLDIDSKIIIDYLKGKGHAVKSHMSAITDEDYAAIKAMTEKKDVKAATAPATAHHPAEEKKHAAAAHPAHPQAPQHTASPAEIKKEKNIHADHSVKHAVPAAKPAPEPVQKPEVQTVKPVEHIEAAPAKPDVTTVIPPVPAAPVQAPAPAPEEKEVIEINHGITVGELAKKLEIKPVELIKKLIGLGVIATINQTMNEEEIHVVVSEYGKELVYKEVTGDEIFGEEAVDAPEDLKHRAPIVTIMGHVDHGKTSLLDAIRETNVAASEAGGITQKIGAYKVATSHGEIIFLDTPGHAAFTAMRARGAKVTDIVVLIVAADDGIMPQTIEAIDHAKAAGAPIIVAINKIDKDGASPDRIKQELTKYNLVTEEWGGKTQVALISAKKKTGINELLEKILLEAEMLELKTNPDTFAVGTLIEGKLDKGRGPVGTVLLQKGTLHVGDPFITNFTFGKVKAIIDDKGQRLKEAKAVMPVEILGFEDVPNAGDKFKVFENEKEMKQIASKRSTELRRLLEEKKKKKMTLEDLHKKIELGLEKKLNLIIKGDGIGSIEAISDAITKLSSETNVNINIIHKDVGDITETDVLLADASDAVIIGFFVTTLTAAKELASKEGVEIKMYHIIYEVVDAIKAAVAGMLEPEYEEIRIGEAEVRQAFKIESEETVIAGSYMRSGKTYHDCTASVIRGGKEILKEDITSLRRFKDSVKEVKEGYEFGVVIKGYKDVKDGDILIFFQEVQKVKKI
jgi:translation initiation factor IF-2